MKNLVSIRVKEGCGFIKIAKFLEKIAKSLEKIAKSLEKIAKFLEKIGSQNRIKSRFLSTIIKYLKYLIIWGRLFRKPSPYIEDI